MEEYKIDEKSYKDISNLNESSLYEVPRENEELPAKHKNIIDIIA
jgi:hypothetical protein